MSPPAANTRSSRTPTAPSDGESPSTEAKTPPSFRFPLVAIPEETALSVEETRKNVLEVLMDPKAHQVPSAREEFSRRLSALTRSTRADADDVLFQIAAKHFGMRKYKVVLVGSAGVGKTAFVSRLLKGKFQPDKYVPTQGADVTNIVFSTTGGPIMFELWDTAGIEKLGRLRDGYYVGADAGIVMFDLTSKASYNELKDLHKDFIRVCGGIPIVLTGNKLDDKKDRKVKPELTRKIARQKKMKHFELSSKTGVNVEGPLLHLARVLTGDNQLRFELTSKMQRWTSSGGRSDVAEAASRLTLEDPPPNNGSDVLVAAALALPPSGGDKDRL